MKLTPTIVLALATAWQCTALPGSSAEDADGTYDLRAKAWKLVDGNRYAEALPLLEKAYAADPKGDDVNDQLIYSLFHLNQFQRVVIVGERYLATEKPPADRANILFYYARALAKLKHFAESYAVYDKYFDLRPKDPNDWWIACADFEDPTAASYMYSLYTEYSRRFPQHEGVKNLALTVKSIVQRARAGASLAKVDAFDAMITYRDPQHPDVSNEFRGIVKEGLRAIPPGIWEKLMKFGCKVLMLPRIIDVPGVNANEHPRGYAVGETYRNCPAFYQSHKKTLFIAEFYDDKGKTTASLDPADAVCHETGHAVDHYLGGDEFSEGRSQSWFSHGPEFSAAYAKDAASLTPAERKRLCYYIQDGSSGQEELFAELFSIIFDLTAVAGSDAELITKKFPTCIRLVKQKLHVGEQSIKR